MPAIEHGLYKAILQFQHQEQDSLPDSTERAVSGCSHVFSNLRLSSGERYLSQLQAAISQMAWSHSGVQHQLPQAQSALCLVPEGVKIRGLCSLALQRLLDLLCMLLHTSWDLK